MNCVVAQQHYKFPSGYVLLGNNNTLERELSPTDLSGLDQLAEEIGFKETGNLITARRGSWDIYERRDYEMPGFPEGSTTVHAMLGLYGTEKGTSQALLRISGERFGDDEFYANIQKLTRKYIERPRVFGFPSKASSSLSGFVYSMLAGITVGAGIGYLGDLGNEWIAVGAIMGEISAPAIYGVQYALGNRYAKSGLPFDELVAGNSVEGVLEADKFYQSVVPVKKELYNRLKDEGLIDTPQEFIENVYNRNVWPGLVELRLQERRAEEQGKKTVADALERMVNVVRQYPTLKPQHSLCSE